MFSSVDKFQFKYTFKKMQMLPKIKYSEENNNFNVTRMIWKDENRLKFDYGLENL